MTDLALSPQDMAREGDRPPGPEPVKPGWLRSATTAAVVAAHVIVFAILAYAPKPKTVSLDSISMDLVQEGDFFEQEEVAEADDTPPPEAVEEPEIALPPPLVMAPDAVPLPAKKEDVDKVKKKVEQQQVQRAQQRQQAQTRRRYGAPEGHAASSGASQATCLAHVAAALRRHTPGSTSLGPGHANVTFHVNPGGGLSGISASGSTPGHAALARRIVSSSRGPSMCGAAHVSQAFAFH
ncbi:MAG: energy transducer TonB [Methylocystis sp.]|uniref:energy transducer TonB n=1 Tax=Methylocystis sp. TaxID=1911079 RepID=UPI003D12A80B